MMRMMVVLQGVVFLLVALFCSPVSAAIVRTLDGRTFDGDVRLAPGGYLLVSNKGANPVRVDTSNLLQILFQPKAPNAPEVAARPVLPAPWTARDIGPVGRPGSAAFANDAFALTSAGPISGKADAFHFLYQPLRGDGEIILHFPKPPDVPNGRVGIMIRETLEPTSRFAFLAIDSEGNVTWTTRKNPRGDAHTLPREAIKPPLYLQLIRQQHNFVAKVSSNQRDWKQVSTDVIRMEQVVLIGAAMATQRPDAPATVALHSLAVGGPGAAPAGEIAAIQPPRQDPDAPPPLAQGIVMRDGTQIAGEIHAADNTSVRFTPVGQPPMTIPHTRLARIVFQPLPRSMVESIPPNISGVLLTDGDFFAGEILEVRNKRVTVSSIVFGPRTFSVEKEAAAACFNAVETPRATFTVFTTAGAQYFPGRFTIAADQIEFDDPHVGRVVLPAAELHTLTNISDQIVQLGGLSPVASQPGADGAPAFAIDRPAVPDMLPLVKESTFTHAVGIGPGASVSYSLDSGYRTFIARVAVPLETPAGAQIRLIALADGKEIARTPDLSADAPPHELTLRLEKVKTLMLRTEVIAPSSKDEFAPSILLLDPLLIRPQ